MRLDEFPGTDCDNFLSDIGDWSQILQNAFMFASVQTVGSYLITDLKDMRTHDDASAECQKQQGHLVKVDSIQERYWLVQKVYYLWKTQRLVFFWVGLSNRPRTDSTGFKWEDQTDLDRASCIPDNAGSRKGPDNDGTEHCGDLWYGQLNDDNCNEHYPYICEMPMSRLASSGNIDDFHAVQNKLNCTFDADFCQWTQAKNDDFDWTRHTGSTPTDETGPTTDHGGSGDKPLPRDYTS
ncbi:hypothetical protein DPMN_138468 [Dreissena polymorpha]|uniref:C-type lectin domain-containing protein n=1 Tax=Dreissena polymorpha TaxID=45954 RepID=A0A9D4JJV2_DREPO|nr:hypothetical protein DPMN_138468 [Dreissena polymorpha]